ncbi:hypothetical protein LguiB_006867 [Lonicera macranthoides]
MASMLRTKSFGFRVTDVHATGVTDVFHWWNEINESQHSERAIFFTLCAAYALVSIVALVQLIRIQLRVPEYGWTTQKVFHLMNFVVNGLRAILFGLHRSVYQIRPKALEMIVLDVPGLLFFSTYTLLVLFWAEIYHQARSLPIDKLRPAYFIVNGFIYFTQLKVNLTVQLMVIFGINITVLVTVCYWVQPMSPARNVLTKFEYLTRMDSLSVVSSFCAALGFMIYGGRLFVMLRRFPIESRGRQKKLHEVGFVTGICCTCFLIRCFVVALSAFDEDVDVDVLDHPVLDLVFYMVVEILPSAMVLFILRKLPPRRVSDQYHPIK